MATEYNRDQIIEAVEATWASTSAVLAGLDEGQWGTQSLCPDWTVKGVLDHLGAIEIILDGWVPESAETPLPFDKMPDAMATLGALSGPDALAHVNALMQTRLGQMRDMPGEVFNGPSMTPVGPQTYARFMAVRVFDFWVHEQDIRTPLGIAGDPGDLAGRVALNEVELSLGYIFGKKVGLEDGQSMTVNLTGPIHKDIHVAVDGRAGQVDALENPTATLTTDSITFMQLACGRIDPQAQIDAGNVTWSGDAALGEKAAKNLAFTM